MWSRLTGEPPLTVIFAVRRLVFICGETDAIEPLMIVPVQACKSRVACRRCRIMTYQPTRLELDCNSLVGALHKKSEFPGQPGAFERSLGAIFQHLACARILGASTYLTSFMIAVVLSRPVNSVVCGFVLGGPVSWSVTIAREQFSGPPTCLT